MKGLSLESGKEATAMKRLSNQSVTEVLGQLWKTKPSEATTHKAIDLSGLCGNQGKQSHGR
jgi:hypothetical protein